MISNKKWIEMISNLNTWKQGSQRAPHKPLMILMLIARASRKGNRTVYFSEIDEQLTDLLKEFGPSRKSYHPENPFWHLSSDGFWFVNEADGLPKKKGGKSPSKKILLDKNVFGSVNEELWNELVDNSHLRIELTDILLNEFWPDTRHSAIRQSIGLSDLISTSKQRRKRDPKFRKDVIRAYQGRCAVCGFDVRLANIPLGIQAAHIKWHSYNGPDDVSNGVALCSFHHLALDSGAIGLDESKRIIISSDITGSNQVNTNLYNYEGKQLASPQPGFAQIDIEYIQWHQSEVFKKPARLLLSGSGHSIAADGN